MDRSQEQLLKRLELLKQKIQEQYPELAEKMANEHLKKLRDKKELSNETSKEEILIKKHK